MRKSRDDPRVCGEHRLVSWTNQATSGSSPRVRGTPHRAAGRLARGGIIPACAGNTRRIRCPSSLRGDHPRVCGEHADACSNTLMWPGSSPRVRGTPREFGVKRASNGIIPACAGNTATRTALRLLKGDHPRVCGEHVSNVCAADQLPGSSPRVRGTPYRAR